MTTVTGNDSATFTVPSHASKVGFELTGPGGAGGGGTWDDQASGFDGGDGGFIEVELTSVSGGEGFTVYAGTGGQPGDSPGSTSQATGGAGGTTPYATGDGGAGGDSASDGGGSGGGAGAVVIAVRDSDGAIIAAAGAGGGGQGGHDSVDDNFAGCGGGGARGGVGGTGTNKTTGGDAEGSGAGGDGGGDAESGIGQPGGTAAHGDVTTVTATDGGGASGGAGATGQGNAGADGTAVVAVPPTQPGLSVDSHTNTSVTLSITDSESENGYRVEYREAGASSWTEFSDIAADSTSEIVTGLTEGTDYEFRVVAYNELYTTASATLTQRTDVPEPTSIDISNADADNNVPGTEADIVWVDEAADEAGYRVYLSIDRFTTKTNVSGDLAADTESYTESGLLHGERYQVGVAVFTDDVEVLVTETT